MASVGGRWEVHVGVSEKMEAMSVELMRLDFTDDVTEEGGAATPTNPDNRLSRGSAHKPPQEEETDGSKVKSPL